MSTLQFLIDHLMTSKRALVAILYSLGGVTLTNFTSLNKKVVNAKIKLSEAFFRISLSQLEYNAKFLSDFFLFFFGFLQIFIREYFLLKKIADGKSRFFKASRSRIYLMQEKILRKRVSTDFSFLEIMNFNKLRLFIIYV